jgi:hypothetical protein
VGRERTRILGDELRTVAAEAPCIGGFSPCHRPRPGDAFGNPPPQRVDIEGGGLEPPPGREPITGPVGVVLCGGGAAVVLVGLGVDVGCGRGGAGLFAGAVVDGAADEDDAEEACWSLMDPSVGRSPWPGSADEPCSSGAPLGRSAAPGLLAFDDTTALLVNCPGGWLTGLLQAAQTRAAATAVAAALAGATVPRIGMVATVAK